MSDVAKDLLELCRDQQEFNRQLSFALRHVMVRVAEKDKALATELDSWLNSNIGSGDNWKR